MTSNQANNSGEQPKAGLFTSLKDFLDPCFLPLGFERSDGDLGKLGSMAGANYLWEQNGRTIKVHCSRRSRTRYAGEIRYHKYVGHSLSFTISTPVKTRLNVIVGSGISKAINQFVSRAMKFTHLTEQPLMEHLDTWVIDEAWSRDYLNDTAVNNAITTLLPSINTYRSARFGFSPNSGSFLVQLNIHDITPERVADWFHAINTLLDIAEANPPLNEVEPSWMEKQSPKTVAAVWIGGFFGIFIMLMGVFCACMTTILILGAATSGG